MELSYKHMSESYVYPLVQEVQTKVLADVAAALAKSDNGNAGAVLGEAQTTIQRGVANRWWELAEMLVVRYNDYCFNFPPHAPTTQSTIGYPAFWLEMIGYNQDFYKPKWLQPAVSPPLFLTAAERVLALESCKVDGGTKGDGPTKESEDVEKPKAVDAPAEAGQLMTAVSLA